MPHKEVVMIPVSSLVDFEEQPFKVLDDAAMMELVDSIRYLDILTPITVRKKDNSIYEIVSGHRRKRACEILKKEKIPAFVEELTDADAAIMLVDSNLQRENLLPSEKAYAYKLKLDALKHQGKRDIETCRQVGDKLKSADEVGRILGESGRQVQRYIRLTELVYQLLEKVDAGLIPLTAGTEISYLDVMHQVMLNDFLDKECCGVTIHQARLLRQNYEAGKLLEEELKTIFRQEEKEERFYLNSQKLKSYFPKHYTLQECEEALWEILDKMKM